MNFFVLLKNLRAVLCRNLGEKDYEFPSFQVSLVHSVVSTEKLHPVPVRLGKKIIDSLFLQYCDKKLLPDSAKAQQYQQTVSFDYMFAYL